MENIMFVFVYLYLCVQSVQAFSFMVLACFLASSVYIINTSISTPVMKSGYIKLKDKRQSLQQYFLKLSSLTSFDPWRARMVQWRVATVWQHIARSQQESVKSGGGPSSQARALKLAGRKNKTD